MDLEWKNLYKNHGFNDKSFQVLIPNANCRPEIFHSKENELPREVSLRITAIRETFEECGILLCEQSSKTSSDHFTSNNVCPLNYFKHDLILIK